MSARTEPESAPPRRGLQPAKREAIVRAARVVFGRDGYARAGIDAIAADAGVSTRTIYKHFAGKEQLFASVLEESATEVADAFEQTVATRLRAVGDDAEAALNVLGHAMLAQRTEHAAHFAMTRQINAEAPYFPDAVIDAWQEAGPRRVQRRIEAELRWLADVGRLRVADPERATRHLIALVSADQSTRPYVGSPPTGEELTAMVAHGVRAFLHGYAAPPA
jgi:AcrR family transcriptional regulator